MKKYLFFLFGLFLILAACQSEKEQNVNESPFLPLSYTGENGEEAPIAENEEPAVEKEEPIAENEELATEKEEPQVIEVDEEIASPPSFGVPQEEPAKQEELEKSLQEEKSMPSVPIDEFVERWNAIAEEQASGLTITGYEKADDFYKSSIGTHELRIYQQDQLLRALQLHTPKKKKVDALSMLMCWSQIILMFEPEADHHAVDELFHHFGVGPNLDLTNVTNSNIERNGVHYSLMVDEARYVFEATVQDGREPD